MTTDTTGTGTTTAARGDPGPIWFRPVGRHRKPRRRRVALAAGGFALAAGALSLVRLAPESVTDGGGTAQAEPRIDTTAVAPPTTATVEAVPSTRVAGPSRTDVLERESRPIPTASAATHPPSAVPGATDPPTGIPEAPSVPTASRRHGPPAATHTPAAPRPTPSPPATTHTPAPPAIDPPGLCLPIIALCVNGLSGPSH
ncbi:hypothetical protein ACFOZ0_22350 [Streptomyces yaanensis]|uniref:Uncharacterized protein n=1 Tax=Streptomyces yaanensis TaxID=1142239 RepID=A0ABV7SI76_9ACTN|nr:hypothetical protein [Streptomyces sp. CGMCC 4.7035]WNB97433.1 hypothetical protein Q2K21_04740 [Streptomyces sp. CGMCC 4.7035]